jgi:hypothetical protein
MNLTAAELLDVWERGLNQPPLERIFILLTFAFPDRSPVELLELSIGQRDRFLLQLRQYLFGQQLLNTAICPQCGQRLEWESKVADFFLSADEVEQPLEMNIQGWCLRFRLPNSLDVAATIGCQEAAAAQKLLLARCVLHLEHDNAECAVEELPDEVAEELLQRMEEADLLAEICLQLHCPACSHDWDAVFDIGSFLWTELNDWAERMLRTVHRLAAGYGWSEQEILALSPVRRQLYSGMLGW